MKHTVKIYVDSDAVTDGIMDATHTKDDATDEEIDVADNKADDLENILNDYLDDDFQITVEIDDVARTVVLVKPVKQQTPAGTPPLQKVGIPALNKVTFPPVLTPYDN